MMRFENFRNLPNLATLVIVSSILIVSILIGWFVPIFGVGIREMIIVVLALAAGVLFFAPADRVLRFGLVLWIITFGFGWRTIRLNENVNIHPTEALVWLLFFVMIARSVARHHPLDFSIPVTIPLFMMCAVLGIFTALNTGFFTLDAIFQEFKILFALLPSYYILKWLVVTKSDWERAMQLALIVAVYVSTTGILESLGGRGSVASYQAETVPLSDQFGRAGFGFYGNYSAGFFIFTFFGMAGYNFLSSFRKNWRVQLLSVGALTLCAVAMYISGYRGLWYSIGIFMLAYTVVDRRAWVFVGASALASFFLPDDFFYRAISLFDPRYADSSQYNRFDRMQFALNWVNQYPLTGGGYGASGYVHSDLLQIAGNLGIPALLIILALWFGLTWRMFVLSRKPGWSAGYAAALFASLCGMLLVLATEGLVNFAQLMVPVWFLFGMVQKLFELARQAENEQAIGKSKL